MERIKPNVLFGICSLLFLLLLFKSCELQKARQVAFDNKVPDTVYVPRPYKVVEIQKEYVEKPVKVYVYPKDTALRKKVEKGDIITGIDFKRHNLFHKFDLVTIDKIDTAGLVIRNDFEVPPVREIKIDFKGNLQVKKKRFLGLKISAGIVAASVAAFFIHKEFAH